MGQLPALQIVVPLMAAPLCALLWRGWMAWLLATLASVVALVVAFLLLQQTLDGEVIRYYLGGWEPPWGIEYRIDALNALVLLLVAGVGTVAMLHARVSLAAEVDEEKLPLTYAAYLLCLTGLLGIAITGDAFNVFVFLEISSLSTYALVAQGRDRRALTAAYQYLIMGTVGATFILIGIGLLYVETGTLNMLDLRDRIPDVAGTRTVRAGFAFLTVGISVKLALFPLHLWLPNAYAYAPSAIGAFLAGTATKVAVYLLLRFFFTIFGAEFSFETMDLGKILMFLALLGIFVTSTVAIFQDSVRKLLAYSSVAQIGYMILGVSFASAAGVMATVVHFFNHGLMKGALFLAVACVFYRVRSVNLERFAGLGWKMPWTMAAFVVGGLSLIGVPLTAGFVSKWYLISAALEAGMWPVALLVLISSLLAVIYVWKVVEVAYFREAPADSTVTEAPLALLIPTWILAGANLFFGIFPQLVTSGGRMAAQNLLGVMP
mgnify:CR=1 FL=1